MRFGGKGIDVFRKENRCDYYRVITRDGVKSFRYIYIVVYVYVCISIYRFLVIYGFRAVFRGRIYRICGGIGRVYRVGGCFRN